MNKKEYVKRVPIDKDNICIYRDLEKCTNCGACKGICNFRMGVYGHYDMEHSKKPICINCGQCSLVCPNNAICEVEDYKKVKRDLKNGYKIIVEIAPATRFLLGDEFGYKPGKNVIGKLITALHTLGVSYVFDTSFGADLTICEEASEFVKRLNDNNNLPMFTSCCPAWVKYMEEFYSDKVGQLSSVKSPILMMGAVIKNYFVKENNIDKYKVVAIVPCTAKKYEITKSNDVDYAITVREMARWIREEKLDFRKLDNQRFDDFTGTSAGLIFGASGGVMEAMLRYSYYLMTHRNPPKRLLNNELVRGLEDIKTSVVKIGNREIRVAVINGTGDVPKLMNRINDGEKFDIVEVMACDGGCIAGGGGSKQYKITNTNKISRSRAIYHKDKTVKRKNSYENPKIKKIYKELLIEPNSPEAIKLLHVNYR